MHSGSVVTNPSNTTTHTNTNIDIVSNLDETHEIGVIGKGKLKTSIIDLYRYIYIYFLAVHIPLRTKAETDLIRMQNNNTMNDDNDNNDTMSDEFDSDSKENDNVSLYF